MLDKIELGKNSSGIQKFPLLYETFLQFGSHTQDNNLVFFLNWVKENHSLMKHEDSQSIRDRIKLNISALTNTEELKAIYEKCFTQRKKLYF